MVGHAHTTHLKGLDGLRGLAALAVFGVHFNQIVDLDARAGPFDLYLLLANGGYGVALFFILSGSLLSMPFWRSALYYNPRPNLKKYALRRVARIVPAYYLLLTVLILNSGYWRYPEAWKDIVLHYSFFFNYFEFSLFSINAPFWTLAVEMQFYLLLPGLFLLLYGRSLRLSIIILLSLGLAAYCAHAWLVSSVEKPTYWPGSDNLLWIRPGGGVLTHSLLAHIPHFLLGVICGGILSRWNSISDSNHCQELARFDIAWLLVCLILLVLLSTELVNFIEIPWGRYALPIVPVLLAALVVVTPRTWHIANLLESFIPRHLGQYSYGIYIFHLPIMRSVDQYMLANGRDAPDHWLLFGVSTLFLTLFAATLSYYGLERPILHRVHREKL